MTTDITQLEIHRPALAGHCYRMLGSVVDADDAAQETMIRAWRNLDQFDGRAALRTWLYRIATNVCLDELGRRSRRARPMEEGPPVSGPPFPEMLIQRPHSHWIEPIADARALPVDADPSERAILRQSIRLAFVAALQHLAPKQRAVLLLIEVLGWSAAEVAETLETSVAAVNSALQRARATLANRNDSAPEAISASQEHLLNRYVAAFEQYDVDGLTSLLRTDATFSMPLMPFGFGVLRLFAPGCSDRGRVAGVPGWHPSPLAVHLLLANTVRTRLVGISHGLSLCSNYREIGS